MFWTASEKEEKLVVGLLSGTSADGIDAALVKIAGQGPGIKITLTAFDTLRFSPAVRDRILAAQGASEASAREILLLSSYLGELFAHAAAHICRKAGVPLSDVDFIGSHGQTLYHHPTPEKLPGFAVTGSLQVGNAAVIAERTGVTVVSDFRSRDMAAGGQGAPLAAYLDYVLFNHRSRSRILLNIGGIANVTALPADVPMEQTIAFDTGPGNCLLDLAATHFTQGKQTFDKDGVMGGSGRADAPLLERLLAHPYFRVPPPKSLEKEQFGKPFLEQILQQVTGMPPADVMATLTAFTVRTIASGILEHLLQKGRYEEIIVSGGGVKNPAIMAGLKAAFPRMAVTSGDDYEIPAKAKEAVLMAFLANETLLGQPGNLPSATGARRPVILGSVTPGGAAKETKVPEP